MIIRKPAVSGMFYPATKDKLDDELVLYLSSVQEGQEKIENISAIVVPHAGYVYSGRTAAYAYKLLENSNYEKVIIISPSHKEYFPGVSVFNGDAYQTPLGIVNTDKDLVERLTADNSLIFKGEVGHRSEHAVEVQLPFLQKVLKEFKFVPVVVGDQRKKFIYALAEKIAEVMDEKTLLVASTDLSHFYTKEEGDKLDLIIENKMRSFDYEELQHSLEMQNCEACGGGGIVAVMRICYLLNKRKIKILDRTDSSYVSGNTNEVVGYLSAVIYE